MKELEVGFCSVCSDQIISRRLSIFWKCTCMSALTDKDWVMFEDTDREANKYIKALEKKNYIVSTDHEDLVLIKPLGVSKREDGSYLVCIEPEDHFEVENPPT